jgi:hypothetical protein
MAPANPRWLGGWRLERFQPTYAEHREDACNLEGILSSIKSKRRSLAQRNRLIEVIGFGNRLGFHPEAFGLDSLLTDVPSDEKSKISRGEPITATTSRDGSKFRKDDGMSR